MRKIPTEKYEYYGKPGDIEKLILEIVEETGLPYDYVETKMKNWVYLLPQKQQYVFQAYYYFKKSITEIRYAYGERTNSLIDRSLQAAIKNIKKTAKCIKL